jgi:hypothetical protein
MDDDRVDQRDRDYVRSGKGRRDEVGRSGIYPASLVDAPPDAKAIGQEELGHRSAIEALARAEDVQLAEDRDANKKHLV